MLLIKSNLINFFKHLQNKLWINTMFWFAKFWRYIFRVKIIKSYNWLGQIDHLSIDQSIDAYYWPLSKNGNAVPTISTKTEQRKQALRKHDCILACIIHSKRLRRVSQITCFIHPKTSSNTLFIAVWLLLKKIWSELKLPNYRIKKDIHCHLSWMNT